MLALTPPAGPPIPLRGVVVRRSLGSADVWLAEPTGEFAALAACVFEMPPSGWRVRWRDTDLSGTLAPDGERAGALALALDPAPDPRRRVQVHAGHSNLLDLLQSPRLGGAVAVREPDTRTELGRVVPSDALPAPGPGGDGGAPGIVLSHQLLQPYVTNLEWVRSLVAGWNALRPDRPFALSAGRPWQLVGVWGRTSAGGLPALAGPARVLGLGPPGAAGAVRARVDRHFSAAAWERERDAVLPHWLGADPLRGLVGAREDTLRVALGGTERLEWSVEVIASRGAWWDVPADRSLGPVFARGRVVERIGEVSVVVELDDADPAARRVECLALTASTGENNKTGAHFPAYPGATVLVAVAGGLAWGPAAHFGAVRHEEPVTVGPSVEFEHLLSLLSQLSVVVRETGGGNGAVAVEGGKVKVSGNGI
jgi:hypothetical protein